MMTQSNRAHEGHERAQGQRRGEKGFVYLETTYLGSTLSPPLILGSHAMGSDRRGPPAPHDFVIGTRCCQTRKLSSRSVARSASRVLAGSPWHPTESVARDSGVPFIHRKVRPSKVK